MQTGVILLWILVLILIVYFVLCVRYHYRIAKDVTLLQCSHDSFEVSLLDERQPIVCDGFQHTQVFQKMKQNTSSSTSTLPKQDIYAHLKHIQPWWSTPQPIRTLQLSPNQSFPSPSGPSREQHDLKQKQNTEKMDDDEHNEHYKKCEDDICLMIQTHGTSSVWLVHPEHKQAHQQHNQSTKESSELKRDTSSYTEVVLREGTGIFIPFQWWYAIHNQNDTSTLQVISLKSPLSYIPQ